MRKRRVPYYTPKELADEAGLGRAAVHQAVLRGQLETVTTIKGTMPLIEKEEAERWLSEPRKRGPKPKE